MNFLKISYLTFIIGFRALSFGQVCQQTETLYVTPFGVDQGLRQSMVSRVIQDKKGLIWMTTGDGLHCFDGRAFRTFRVPVNDVYSHSDNIMRDIVESAPGVLTVSSSSSLLQFNTSTGHFGIVSRKGGSYPVLLDQLIDEKPAAWFHDMKLYLVDRNRLHPKYLVFEKTDDKPGTFYPGNTIRIASGELLISDAQGIVVLDIGNPLSDSSYRVKWMPVADCQAIARDNSGRVFILANGKILQYLEHGKLKEIFDTRIKNKMDLFIDSKNNFWVTGRSGSKQYKLSEGVLRELKFCYHDGKHVDSIAPDIISVYEDDHHNIWFGTGSEGVMLYAPEKKQFLKSDIGFTRCMTWFNNEIWAGTYKNGLWRISPDLSKAKQVHAVQGEKGAYYLDLATDRYGRLWIATRNGLKVIDHAEHTVFSHPFSCQGAKMVIQSDNTVNLFCDSQLHRYIANEKPSFIDTREFVSVFAYKGLKDAIWIGNQFGLYRSATNPGFNKDLLFVSRNKLTSSAVYSVLGIAGEIWAATGNGIEIFDMDGKRRPLPANIKELQNEVIYALLPDDFGKIWFSGNLGIGCIDGKKNRMMYFNTQNDLQSLEFNYNAACRSPDGRLYFGGIRGINGFDPAWFNKGKKDEEVRLISLSVSDTSFVGGIPAGNIKLTLNRQAPHLSGRVFCSDYTNAGKQLFTFILEGYQKNWSKPSQDAEFNYRDLPPGQYRLMVKCADPWQNWSEPVTLVSVTLKPPFWETAWFLIVLIVVIVAATGLLVRKINSIRYMRQILILEKQSAVEKERLRISKDMHDDLGASLTRISILSELAKKQQEDPVKSKQIIEQISDISGGVVDEMSEIIWAMNPRNDTRESFTSYIRQYASSYVESAGMNGRFQFPGEIPDGPMPSELRRNLFLTVKEALHNIVKHSGACNVLMQLDLKGEILQITITDDGKGFVIENISGWGNGLVNMRKRMEEYGGRIDITSEVGKGTRVELSITLPGDENSH